MKTSNGSALLHWNLNAINAPIDPPINKKIKTYKSSPTPTERNVTIIAIVIPAIPK